MTEVPGRPDPDWTALGVSNVFRRIFGTDTGMAVSAVAMVVYATVPVLFGLRAFRRKDL